MTLQVAGILLGGVGIFLTGIWLLTDGLKAAAGDSLRHGLHRAARTPTRALASGTALTALVQSSSAATLTTIGFVSAGLLTFPQAVGVIFGANLGTTSTGWIVSVLGLRVSMGAIALPLVGVGALVRLAAHGRAAQAGTALVGFGLIFVGIDTLQVGMEGLSRALDPSAFPGSTFGGRIALVGLGVVMTVVMQSSSAAVATTLTALHAGTIDLDQAALLVVGQNMGTTVKAALAAVGGSLPVRRTAAAHILFNLFTGAVALVLLPLLLFLAVAVVGEEDPAIAIALFHSLFNLLGVALLFPFLGPFARGVERLVPETEIILTRHLDPSLHELPSVAVEAGRRSGLTIAEELFRQAVESLEGAPGAPGRGPADRESAGEALERLRSFLTGVPTSPGDEAHFPRHLSTLHATDHLERFRRALKETGPVAPELGPALSAALQEWRAKVRPEEGSAPDPERLSGCAASIARARKGQRARLLEEGATGRKTAEAIREGVDGLLRLDRLAYHAWRAAHHLHRSGPDQEPEGEWEEGPE